MKKLRFAAARVAYIIFTVGVGVLIPLNPQGLKPWLLTSLMFTKEKGKKQPMTKLGIMIALIMFCC